MTTAAIIIIIIFIIIIIIKLYELVELFSALFLYINQLAAILES